MEQVKALYDALDAIEMPASVSDNGIIVAVNKAFRDGLRWTGEEIVGKDGIALLPKEEQAAVVDAVSRGVTDFRVVARLGDGTLLPLRVVSRTLLIEDHVIRATTLLPVGSPSKSDEPFDSPA